MEADNEAPGGTDNNKGPEGTPPGENPDAGKSNEALLNEKKEWKGKARAAEEKVKELETKLTESTGKVESIVKENESLAEKVKGFEFKETKSQKVSEFVSKIPEGKVLSNPDALRAHVAKLTNPETLDADIESFVTSSKLIVDHDPGQKVSIGGKPSGSQTPVGKVDLTNPAALAKLYAQDPVAFHEAVKAAQATAAPVEVRILGQNNGTMQLP